MHSVVFAFLAATVLQIRAANYPLFPSLPVTPLGTSNASCNAEGGSYVQNLGNFTLWASEMWDATAKSATGVLSGSIFQMGQFHECLSAGAPFATKYCLVQLRVEVPLVNTHRDPLSLHHRPDENILERLYPYKDISQQVRNTVQAGWCVPASCSSHDMEEFLSSYINTLDLPLIKLKAQYTVRVPELTCTTNEENKFSAADICFCALAAILVTLVIVATIHDYFKFKMLQFLSPFSARTNLKNLSKKDESNGALTILYGLRTLSILFIVSAHRFGTFISSALLNFNDVEKEYRSVAGAFLTHEDLFVDIFFIMSGLLVTYGMLNQLEKKSIAPGFFILMRYVRLTPVYAFVIFYYATLFNHSGTGPLWKVIAGQDSQDCKDNWWTNLLYINNYVNADHMCMSQSWYLPCDFHYFILAVMLSVIIKKSKSIGLCILLFLTILSLIIPFTLTLVYQRPAMLYFYPDFLTSPKTHPDFLLTYIKSHTRATVYFLGMFVGYVYHKTQKRTIRLSRLKSYSLVALSILLIVTPFVGSIPLSDRYHQYNALEAATYAALSRPAFAIGTIGLIYVCGYGHGGFLTAILNWALWVPLSKLVYGVYLVHMQFQLRAAASFMHPRYFSYFDVITLALADIMWSFFAACGLYLAVEAPFKIIFQKCFFKRGSNLQSKTIISEVVNERNEFFVSKL